MLIRRSYFRLEYALVRLGSSIPGDVSRRHLPASSLGSSSNGLERQESLLSSPSLCSWSSSLSESSGRVPVASHLNRFLISFRFRTNSYKRLTVPDRAGALFSAQ